MTMLAWRYGINRRQVIRQDMPGVAGVARAESLTNGAPQMRPGIRIIEGLQDYNHPVILVGGIGVRV